MNKKDARTVVRFLNLLFILFLIVFYHLPVFNTIVNSVNNQSTARMLFVIFILTMIYRFINNDILTLLENRASEK